MDTPWLVAQRRPPLTVRDASVPPTVMPRVNLSKVFQPDWTMDAPWQDQKVMPFTVDASVPPLRLMDTIKWFQRIPDWQADAPAYIWEKVPLLTPADRSVPPVRPLDSLKWFHRVPDWQRDGAWQSRPGPYSTGTIIVPALRQAIVVRLHLTPSSRRVLSVTVETATLLMGSQWLDRALSITPDTDTRLQMSQSIERNLSI